MPCSTFFINNLNYNSSSTIDTSSFHRTGIRLFQCPFSDNPGEDRKDRIPLVSHVPHISNRNQALKHLPLLYHRIKNTNIKIDTKTHWNCYQGVTSMLNKFRKTNGSVKSCPQSISQNPWLQCKVVAWVSSCWSALVRLTINLRESFSAEIPHCTSCSFNIRRRNCSIINIREIFNDIGMFRCNSHCRATSWMI